MEWQHAFPELLDAEAIEASTDRDALQRYVDETNAAGDERIAAETATEGTLTDEDLIELEDRNASRVMAEARITALDAEAARRASRIAGLGFQKPTAPPPTASTTVTTPPATESTGAEGATTLEIAFKPEVRLAVSSARVGKGVGDILTLEEQGLALIERAKQLSGSKTEEKFPVAKLTGYIDPALILPDDGIEMMRFFVNDKFDDEAIVAGFCALPTTEYGFCGGSSAQRPVFNSMRRYIAPRGRVKKVITPLFGDTGTDTGQIDTTGIDQWTNDDDDAEPFVEKTCSIMTCVDDETFELYSTYKCATIKNFLALAYPEWVAFSGMMLDAHWARFAETLLLDGMMTRAGAAIVGTPVYGAWVSFLSELNQLMVNYVENERYDDAGLAIWLPRWLIGKLRADAILRGLKPPTRSDIESALSDLGITKVTWTMDNPTTYGVYPTQSKGADLIRYPTDAWAILSKPDNLRVMDFGERNIGITTEREYRDTASNQRNDYQVFVETFEGIIDNGCPTWHFRLELCDNGLVAPTAGFDERDCVDDGEFPS